MHDQTIEIDNKNFVYKYIFWVDYIIDPASFFIYLLLFIFFLENKQGVLLFFFFENSKFKTTLGTVHYTHDKKDRLYK